MEVWKYGSMYEDWKIKGWKDGKYIKVEGWKDI